MKLIDMKKTKKDRKEVNMKNNKYKLWIQIVKVIYLIIDSVK